MLSELRPSHDPLLLFHRQSFPLSRLVFPLLQQQHGTGSARNPFRQQRRAGSVEQRRILRAIDEARKIAIVPVRPARSLFRQRRLPREILHHRARHIEQNVISTARQPHQRIMLRAGITNPSVPLISLLNPSTPGGASSGTISRHSSGRNPITKFTPPVVVRGSRIAEIVEANSLRFVASRMSNSRYA